METSSEASPTNTPAAFPLDRRLSAQLAEFIATRPAGADEDVHMLPAIVDHVIERCTQPGDVVLDPFAGFGTTMERAIALDRQAIGVELLPDRVELLTAAVPQAHIIQGDARKLTALLEQTAPIPAGQAVELILTSPPYMTVQDHPADPLTGYLNNDGDYQRYLQELQCVAAQCAKLLAPGGFMVWNVADIHYRGQTTRLIADCARALVQQLSLVGISEIIWDHYPHDLVTDALLVFQREPHSLD